MKDAQISSQIIMEVVKKNHEYIKLLLYQLLSF